MLALKKLVLFLNEAIDGEGPLNKETIKPLVVDALTYLNRTKTLEYHGMIRLPGVAFKLVDLNIDLDDAVKEIFNKRSDIEFNGEFCLVIKETKKDEK